MNINYVVLGGNITKDPEVRYTPGGTAVTDFTIAVNRTWKNKQGEQQKEASFVRCTAMGKTAEVIAQYLKKGSPVLIEGRIKVEQWEDRDQKKRSTTKVWVERLHFVGAKKQEQAEDPNAPPAGAPDVWPGEEDQS